jgi:pimeloyl-ACP methyl ester carboxylesterase
MDRRRFLSAATVIATLASCAEGAGGGSKPAFLLVHGAWHGGWCWDAVAGLLRAQGHAVWAPTLPGMAEDALNATPQINLDSHIRAVMNLIDDKGLRDFALVGHSYGGMVVSGVADQRADRLRSLVYLDAFLPDDGQGMSDILPPSSWSRSRDAAEKSSSGFLIPSPPPAFFGIPPELAAKVQPLLTGQPIATFTQRIQFRHGGWKAVTRRTYIGCDQPAAATLTTFAAIKNRVKAEPGWRYQSLAAGHDAMLTQPRELADALEAAAR